MELRDPLPNELEPLSIPWLQERMEETGLRPSKGLGQSFLHVDWVASDFVSALGIEEGDKVLEIGPGFGSLTRQLALLHKETEFSLTLVEKDKRLTDYLRREFPFAKVVEGDALNIELSGFDRLISNLPYSISSPITGKLLELEFTKAVFMYQKEFAERIIAGQEEKNYSRLGVKAQFRLGIERLGIFPPEIFHPKPKVSSTLLAFTPLSSPPFAVGDEDFFFLTVDVLFAHRRKTIRNCLKQGKARLAGYLKLQEKELDSVIEALPYLGKRVEELTPEEIGELADLVLRSRTP
jgi:16S rRNA (adenine1518-N6/adenine1519-N6)-dimethyltransferase